ncbi:MAG TPA: glycosyltransferase family 1 protein [Candidatus Baltobacteraceae bacterium]|nr:glycosyltransferase family 1 protein [Candidatus Baltobacteraceae bacterium]
MIVALDTQLAIGTATGIGEYVGGLASALRERGVRVVELQEPRLDPWRFDRRVLWDQAVLPRRARASGADLLHCASGTMPLRAPLPTVVTVHDVAWLKVQRHTHSYARYYFGRFALERYRRAAAIVVDSEFSRRELSGVLQVAPERLHVVYPGVSADYAALARKPSGDAAILVPGTVERRKNLEVLIRALPLLPHRARIICVGPATPYRDECERLAARHGVSGRVEFRGYVEREALLDLYATCAVVAVPSIYEGFGYAAAQALCAGTPLVVSGAASLPEVVAGMASIASAEDERIWAREIGAILDSPAKANEHASAQRERGIERFAWRASASTMCGVYETALRTAR